MALGCVNSLFNSCRPCIPQAVSQFVSDHRERIEKVAMIAIFSATCLVTAAAFSFSVVLVLKVSFLLASPTLAHTAGVVGILALALFVFGHAFITIPEKLEISAKRDFCKLLQGKVLEEGRFEETLTVDDKSRIRHIANKMKLSRLISSGGAPVTITFLEMTYITFAVPSLILKIGLSLLFAGTGYVIGSSNYWSSSQEEVERIEKAYSFIATSGVDVKLSVKILKVFYLSRQSEPFFLLNNESNLSSYSLEKAIRGQLTPEEVRDNFGALATMIADAAAESQEVSEEYSLGKLFQIAFSGDVPDDAQLHANPEVIQQAARVAMRDLESAAPEHSLGRLTFGGSLRKVKTEELTKCLEVYHSFLKRTGNAWEGMGSQVIGVRNHLGVKGLV